MSKAKAATAVSNEIKLADGRKVTLKPLSSANEEVLYIGAKDMTIGQNVSGILEKVIEGEYKGKTTYTYLIRIADNSLVGLNGCGHLNWFMRTQYDGGPVPNGAYVSATYEGLGEARTKGEDAPHQFSVQAGLPEEAL